MSERNQEQAKLNGRFLSDIVVIIFLTVWAYQARHTATVLILPGLLITMAVILHCSTDQHLVVWRIRIYRLLKTLCVLAAMGVAIAYATNYLNLFL